VEIRGTSPEAWGEPRTRTEITEHQYSRLMQREEEKGMGTESQKKAKTGGKKGGGEKVKKSRGGMKGFFAKKHLYLRGGGKKPKKKTKDRVGMANKGKRNFQNT